MGLKPRGRGRGRGFFVNFQPEAQNGVETMGQMTMFRPAQPSLVYPPPEFSPKPFFGAASGYGQHARFNFRPPRHSFGKFPGKQYRKNIPRGHFEIEINLTKPWVTEEIRTEENKKQEIFELWKNTKNSENWNEYQAQKQKIQTLYNKARAEYAASHPNEVSLWKNNSSDKQYYCETCDKSFRTEDNLLLHKAEHETCGRDGCDFTAHPKIIAKHIKMQHETGLYKRIGKLYTDEDISKWIEERKKRYPTRKVVEEKKVLEQKKLNRGEKIKEDKSKFNKSFRNKGKGKGKKNFEKKSNKVTRNQRTRKKKQVSMMENCLNEEMPSIRKGVPAFLGIKTVNELVVPEKKDFNISDEEWEEESKPLETVKPLLNSSLGLLATLYDSDADIKNEEPHIELKSKVMSDDEGSAPEESSSKNPLPQHSLIKEKVSLKRKSMERKKHEEKKQKNTSSDYCFEQRSLTLLEKLLKNEIRHERNVILQCVHYVVKNNFFKM